MFLLHLRLRYLLSVLLALRLCAVLGAGSKPRIVPLEMRVVFSTAKLAQGPWSVPIKSADGHTVYILSVEPEFLNPESAGMAELDLVLRRSHDKPDAENLLAPEGNWHGVQSFMFPSWDFKDGIKGSVYGEKRTISAERAGLTVEVTVLEAKVRRLSDGDYLFDELDLRIDVYNEPSRSKPPKG